MLKKCVQELSQSVVMNIGKFPWKLCAHDWECPEAWEP